MSMYRKSYEVTGYVPPDSGMVLCLDCHQDGKRDLHAAAPCDCAAVFLSTETDSVETCSVCFEEIETTVIGST